MNATIRTLRPLAALGLLLCAALPPLLIGCGEADPYEIPKSPFQIIGRVPLPSGNEGVASLGDYAFVAAGQAGLHVIDISTPGAPVLTATINTTKYAESVEIVRTMVGGELRDVALVVEGTEGITSYDVTDPTDVTSFNQGSTAVDGQRIFVEESDDPDEPYVVYLAESWKGVRIFESDPAQPGLLNYNGVFSGTQGYAMGIAVRDGWAYVADDEMGLAVLDVRSRILGEVQLVSWSDTPGNARDVALAGDYAFVADGVEGLAVFAIDADAAPVKVAQLDLTAFSRSIAVARGYAFLAADDGGVHVVDVRDPENPEYAGLVDASDAADVAVTASGHVIIADRDDGFLILRGPSLAADAAAPAPITTLAAAPIGFAAVELAWNAVGDDGLYGTAAAYRVAHAAEAIVDEADWDAATALPAAALPAPGFAGALETLAVDGFTAGQTRWFSVRAVDDEGHLGPLGASAAATTFTGSVAASAAVTPTTGDFEQTFVFELVWLDEQGDAAVVHEVLIDGVAHAMALVSGTPLTGALYRYETLLALGQHDHAFRFEDAEGNGFTTGTIAGPQVTSRILFAMGSPAGEIGRGEDETLHTVALSDSVLAWPTEVTRAEWTAAGLDDPSTHAGQDLPVHNVTWYDAVAFCNARSALDGLTPAYAVDGLNVTWNRGADGWRLPTEAEWEWLCRAGTTAATPAGDLTALQCEDDAVLAAQAWYCGNADGPRPVGGLDANPGGLSDMLGNVREWCWDWYAPYAEGLQLDPEGPATGERRVVRGGSWHYFARECRSAARGAFYPTSADDFVGLRPVRTAVTR